MKLIGNDADGFLTVNNIRISKMFYSSPLSREEKEQVSDAIYKMAFKLQEYENTGLEPDDIERIIYNVKRMYEISQKAASDLQEL